MIRQVGDTLVWLAMVGVVVAVVYFTPRVASYLSTGRAESEHGRLVMPSGEMAYP